jgi:hypothetical protein
VGFDELRAESNRHSVMQILICMLIFAACSNFGLALFNLSPRYALLATILLLVRFCIPLLAVSILLWGPRSFFRTWGLILLVPCSVASIILVYFWYSMAGRDFFPPPGVTESIGPAREGYSEVQIKNDIYCLGDDGWEHGQYPQAIYHSRSFGPFFTQRIEAIYLPGNLVCSFLPKTDDRVIVKIERQYADECKFVMNADVKDILSRRVKLGI